MKIRRYVLRIVVVLTTFVVGLAAVWIFSPKQRETREIVVKPESLNNDSRDFSLSAENYAAYSALLTKIIGGEQIVVSDHTNPVFWENTDGLDRRLFDSGETIADFRVNNLEAFKLENKFTVSGKAFLLSQKEEDNLFPQGGAGWDKFRARFPNARAIIYLSNVGFNREKTEALVHVAHNCRSCNTNFYLLKKIEGEWMVWSAYWSKSAVY